MDNMLFSLQDTLLYFPKLVMNIILNAFKTISPPALKASLLQGYGPTLFSSF